MDTVTAVFRSFEEARRATAKLRRAGFTTEQINLLLPGDSESILDSVPVSETEQPGMGGTVGGVVGAALGMAGGFELGIGATALIPGIGPVVAVGLAAAALLGVGGAFSGAVLGDAAERQSTLGIPADEVFFYEDALRQGRSLLIVLANDSDEKNRARELLAAAGAESLDAAREAWWIGLRDAEEEHYRALGLSFTQDQDAYRAGFEAALRRECRGKPFAEARECLREAHPGLSETKAFAAGYERGLAHHQRMQTTGFVSTS